MCEFVGGINSWKRMVTISNAKKECLEDFADISRHGTHEEVD